MAQALGELGEEIGAEVAGVPVVEDKAQVGETAGLQEQEAVDVVFIAASGTGEVVGELGRPLLQAVEQRLADFPSAPRATGLLEKASVRREDAAPGDDFQAVAGPAEGQHPSPVAIRRLRHHRPRARRQGISHAIAAAAAGAGLGLDYVALHQPAQHQAGLGLMAGNAGNLRNQYRLLRGQGHGRGQIEGKVP